MSTIPVGQQPSSITEELTRIQNRILRHLLRTVTAALFIYVGLSPAHAVKVMLEGTHYQLRRGQSEVNDLVQPYPPEWTPGPYSFLKGTSITIRIIPEPGENITTWKVTGASLYSWPLDIFYWSIPESDWLLVNQTYALLALPPWIDAVTLEGDAVMEADPPGGGALAGSFSRLSAIYVVQDAPKAPMTPAWAPVLNYGCFWAAGESTSTGANNALAQTLWTLGAYNDGVPAYVRNMTGSGETFHLKSFLADPDCPKGECEDFADFLVCLSTSVGASEMKAQRSNVLPYGARFWHKSLTPAGKPGPEVGRFWYHQFGIIGTSVWDGCISITGWDVPKNWTRETTYRPRLVDFYTIGTWDPTPGSGFTPAITTNPLP